MSSEKLCWLDVRATDEACKAAVLEEAVHQRIDGIVSDDPVDWADLPPTVTRVLLPEGDPVAEAAAAADVVIRRGPVGPGGDRAGDGRMVEIHDAASLQRACEAARSSGVSVLDFRDPTKIPLEIVLAAAAGGSGSVVTRARDVEEARVVWGVLELGSGVMVPAQRVGDATALRQAASSQTSTTPLVELEVVGTTSLGMGERACVDTCSYLGQDEGILVGSHSKGLVLCVSETHPLPYMPTRPFRVNAGAIHSYTLTAEGRTTYLSELRAGATVLAVDVSGRTRPVTVGRVKIESRPLLSVDAVGPDGQPVNLILQNDWHVRLLGPGGTVLNCTELRPGDVLLGHLPTQDRHVGYPIDEFCLEQ